MKGYQIVSGSGIAGLNVAALAQRDLSANEVRVRIRAVSLNYRDLIIAKGNASSAPPVIPTSDGAGEVIEVGAAVKRFKVGDRVLTTFFSHWIDGALTPQKTALSLGGNTDGALAQEIVANEQALVAVPTNLDFNEAATLTCAGVTAWNAMFVNAALRPGDSVLLQGTGGVSIWALQLARAAGVRAIITSSSDEKLERAKVLGAYAVINYRSKPEWQQEVLRLTRDEGVNLVVEVGGVDTLKRSIAATKIGGTVAIVGGVSGFGGEIDASAVIGGARRLSGIYVGSRLMLEDLARLVDTARIQPVVDRIFPFEAARDAYAHLEAGRHFGKVVISV